MDSSIQPVIIALFFLAWALDTPSPQAAEPPRLFRAGAAALDITSTNFPVTVLGMFTERTTDRAHDRLYARSVVLDDGVERLALCIVDSCMMPRELLDEAKALARKATGIRTDRMLIAATHTHSAPAAMGALGCSADPECQRRLPGQIAQSIGRADQSLLPAKVGWTVAQDWESTHCRRWILRSDQMLTDPFGSKNVRANMHPGYLNPHAIGPAGPVDPELSILAIQTREGRPVALLANYSMHYFGSPMLSADYFGRFAAAVAAEIGGVESDPPFVGIMSQGTSGDAMWMDYGQPAKNLEVGAYAAGLAKKAAEAYRQIQFSDSVSLAMAEATLTLGFRLPDADRTAWARKTVESLKGRLPQTLPEVYAREQIYLLNRPQAELKIQAVRIGDLGIVALPNEVFGITGLKIKTQSPLQPTFNIELANGAEGYIPPPEQHALGGYTTWPARTAGLDIQAEPKIVERALALLETVAKKTRRKPAPSHGRYAQAVLESKPLAYWRFDEMSGPNSWDATAHHHQAYFEPGIAFFLTGPQGAAFSGGPLNRAPHLAGGRIWADLTDLQNECTIGFWFWNGLANANRTVSGTLLELGNERLIIAETNGLPPRLGLISRTRLGKLWLGTAHVQPQRWHYVAFVRQAHRLAVFLNGMQRPDLDIQLNSPSFQRTSRLWLGGCAEGILGLEGKLDEVAVYARALEPEEITRHYEKSGFLSAAP